MPFFNLFKSLNRWDPFGGRIPSIVANRKIETLTIQLNKIVTIHQNFKLSGNTIKSDYGAGFPMVNDL